MKLEAGTKGFLINGVPHVKGKYEPLLRGNNVGICYREEGKTYDLVSPIIYSEWTDSTDTPYASVQALLDSMETLFFLAESGGVGGIESVTGNIVNNTDPLNPVVTLPTDVMNYKGNWNASINSPTLANGVGNAGDVYRVNIAGTQNLGAGNISFEIGDLVIYSGTIWEKADNSQEAITNGSGTTANGTAVDLGGTLTQDTTIDSENRNLHININDNGGAQKYFRVRASSPNNVDPGYFAVRPPDEGMAITWADMPYPIVNKLPFTQINGQNGWISLGGIGQLETLGGANDPVITDYILKRLTPSPESSIDFEDFKNGIVGTKFSSFTSGAGSSVAPIQITDIGRSGIVALSTGTTAAGSAAIATNIESECADGGLIFFRSSFYIPTLSTALERYVLRIGGGDVVTGDFTDGMYIEYDESSSPNWRGCNANNAVRTKTSPVIIPVAVGWNTVSMEASSNGGAVNFKLNNTIFANNVLNVPKTPARSFGWMFSIIKSVGTTSRSVYVDWVDVRKEFTTSRY